MGNQEHQRDGDLAVMISENIQKVILRETSPKSYDLDRTACEYLDKLMGLKATLDYIRDLKDSNIVVDVGTGHGFGWAGIKYEYGDNLEFWATGLVGYKSCYKLFGDNFRCTSAEIMEGFENNSVGGIIGVKSIAYGLSAPCINRLNEVLVPGGVIKACFENPESKDRDGLFKSHFLFTARLLELGYDVVVKNGTIVVAVKPGGLVRASDLLKNDFEMRCSGF